MKSGIVLIAVYLLTAMAPICVRSDTVPSSSCSRQAIARLRPLLETQLVRRGFALGALPGSPPGTAMGRFPVPPDSYLVNKTVAELCLPEDFLFIHIERSGEVILPHGNTQLQAKDVVTLLSYHGDIAKLQSYWQEISNRPCDEASQDEAPQDEASIDEASKGEAA